MNSFYLKKMLYMKQKLLHGNGADGRKKENLVDGCKNRQPKGKKSKGLSLRPISEPAMTTGFSPIVAFLGNDTLFDADESNRTVSSEDANVQDALGWLCTPPVMILLAFLVVFGIILVIDEQKRWTQQRDILRAFQLFLDNNGNEKMLGQNGSNEACFITFPEPDYIEPPAGVINDDNIHFNYESSAVAHFVLPAVEATDDIQEALVNGKKQGNTFTKDGNDVLPTLNLQNNCSEHKRKETAV